MKIFKNRGDIYISKSGYKSSKEEQILLSILAVIVVFTVVFLAILSHKYSSVAEFFSSGEVTTSDIAESLENDLPKISGKTNFLVIESNDDNSKINYLYLIQADADTLAYKVSSLSPNMKIDGKKLLDVYLEGGGAMLQAQLTEFFGFNIDYYAQFTTSNFVEFFNKMGTFIYPSGSTIKFDGGNEDDSYSIRIREGENRIDGKKFSNLVRYYTNDVNNFENSNIFILYALTGVFNEANYDKCDQLFRLFIGNSSTNITVRDFENAKDKLLVFTTKNKDVTIYSAAVEYDNYELTSESVQNVKGYFSV